MKKLHLEIVNYYNPKTCIMEGPYKTKIGAKRMASKALDHVIVEFAFGGTKSYDWFPNGHPLGGFNGGDFYRAENARIIERYFIYRKKWIKVRDEYDEEFDD